MPLRFWNDSEVPEAKRKDHNQRAHEYLCRAHIAWYWLVGPGSSPLLAGKFVEGWRSWDIAQERKLAQRDAKVNAWSTETLQQVHRLVEDLRFRVKAPAAAQNAPGSRSWKKKAADLDGGFDAAAPLAADSMTRILPTVERDWSETFLLSDEQKRVMLNRVMAGWTRRTTLPRAQRNDMDHGERISQPQAVVLFDGDDQGNERPKDDPFNDAWEPGRE